MDVFECEFSYLKRLGLLLEGEKSKALANDGIRNELETQQTVLRMHEDRLKTIPADKFVRHSLFQR